MQNNRPLTPEELELAPEWATHYRVDKVGDVCFENYDMYEWLVKGQLKYRGVQLRLGDNTSQIPVEPLDLESVEWSDGDIKSVHIDSHGDLDVRFHCNVRGILETKQDIVNKAKALGVTAEDLK